MMPFQPSFPRLGTPIFGNQAPMQPRFAAAPTSLPKPAPKPNAAAPMPVTATMAAGNTLPPAKVRMQAPDPVPTAAARLVLPSPENLGIRTLSPPPATQPAPTQSTPAQTIDWNAVHARLGRLGALAFHLDRMEGACRVTFLLPTGQEQRLRQVEAIAGTEAGAVQAALEQAEAATR